MTDAESYNLVDNQFIPVRRRDGASSEESLLSVFAQAHEIRELAGELPTQSFAILRVLLAILQRAIVTADDFDDDREPAEVWGELWRFDKLPMDVIEAYLHRWHDRFNLFDAERPFMQVAGLRPYNPDNAEGGGLSRIIADYPNRPERALFTQRSGAALVSLTFPEAARWLIHCQAFDTGNNKSRAAGDGLVTSNPRGVAGMNTGWSGKIGGVFIEGESLRETILLNLVLTDPRHDGSLPDVADVPCWESLSPQTARYTERIPRGRTDLYSWQARRVLLQADGGQVTNVLLCPGDVSINVNTHLYEAMTAWKANDKAEFRPVLHQPDKALWRSLSSLLPRVDPKVLRPGVVSWVAFLASDDGNHALEMRRFLTLRGVGVVYESQQNAAIGNITNDALVCSAKLLDEAHAVLLDQVLACVRETEDAVAELGRLSFNLDLASGHRESNPDARKRWAERERRMAAVTSDAYFAIDAEFRQWLASLDPPGDDSVADEEYANDAQKKWRRLVKTILFDRGNQMASAAGPQGFVGRSVKIGSSDLWMTSARAEQIFRRALRKILHIETDEALSSSTNKEGVANA